MQNLPSYGSLKNKGEDEEANNNETSFQEENTYYLKESPPMSAKKVLLLAVPILGAVLMMGGIVLFLLRDFGHLYPGRGGDPGYSNPNAGDDESRHHSTTRIHSLGNTDDTAFDSKSTKSTVSAKCSAHPKCSPLTGQCCPTLDGIKLECCN